MQKQKHCVFYRLIFSIIKTGDKKIKKSFNFYSVNDSGVFCKHLNTVVSTVSCGTDPVFSKIFEQASHCLPGNELNSRFFSHYVVYKNLFLALKPSCASAIKCLFVRLFSVWIMQTNYTTMTNKKNRESSPVWQYPEIQNSVLCMKAWFI